MTPAPSSFEAEPAAAPRPAPPQRTAKLGVAIPLANEEDTIEELLRRVLGQLGPLDQVYCVLDNASRDATREKVEAFAQSDPRVHCVWAPENRCVVDAYFRGYREALADGCDWILEMDGGLSHSPEEIPRFIAAMETGVDFAAGGRFGKQGTFHGPWRRRLLSRGSSILANFVLGTKMRDMTSGFECFSRRAMQFIVDRGVRSRGHFFQTEIRYFLSLWRWVEVPISYQNPSPSVGPAVILESLKNLWLLRSEKRERPNA